MRDVTRPIVPDARFYGAGINPMDKAQTATAGFSAKTQPEARSAGA